MQFTAVGDMSEHELKELKGIITIFLLELMDKRYNLLSTLL